RLEVLSRRPLVLLDCAHNLASIQALVDTLEASFPAHRLAKAGSEGPRRYLVFASSSDKDLAGMLKLLAPHFSHVFLTSFPSPRAVARARLAEILRPISLLPFTVCDRAADAWHAARTAAGPGDLICVTGSVFLAGQLRPLIDL